jgi:hypothetical protein
MTTTMAVTFRSLDETFIFFSSFAQYARECNADRSSVIGNRSKEEPLALFSREFGNRAAYEDAKCAERFAHSALQRLRAPPTIHPR